MIKKMKLKNIVSRTSSEGNEYFHLNLKDEDGVVYSLNFDANDENFEALKNNADEERIYEVSVEQETTKGIFNKKEFVSGKITKEGKESLTKDFGIKLKSMVERFFDKRA